MRTIQILSSLSLTLLALCGSACSCLAGEPGDACAQQRQKDTRPTPYDNWFTDADKLIPTAEETSQPLTQYVLTEADALKVFRQLASVQQIPFRYPEDGCYARAHQMARILEKMHIECGKVFVEGNLKVATKNAPGGSVSWGYHVAPTITVTTPLGLTTMVLDPSIFDRPVSVKDWVGIQTRHDPKGKITISYRSRFNYGPKDTHSRDHWNNGEVWHALTKMDEFLKLQRQREQKLHTQ